MVYPDSLSPVAIFTDASDAAFGAVLEIKRNGIWCLVAFFSRCLDKTQSKYATFDRKLLAVYSAIRHFRHFVECKEFAIYTDHKPLVRAFHSSHSQELGRRVRQMSYVTDFTSNVHYIKGSEIFAADALSRVTINNVKYFRDGIDFESVAAAQTNDAELLEYLAYPDKTSLKLEQFRISNKSSLLLWCDTSTGVVRPLLPESFCKVIFEKIHLLSHLGITASVNLIRKRCVWHNLKKDVTSWVQTYLICQGKVQCHNFSEFKPFALPTGRFQEINLDLVGPLPQSNGCSYILTIIDRCTRF